MANQYIAINEPEKFATIAELSSAVKVLTEEYRDAVGALLADIKRRRDEDAQAEADAEAIAASVLGGSAEAAPSKRGRKPKAANGHAESIASAIPAAVDHDA